MRQKCRFIRQGVGESNSFTSSESAVAVDRGAATIISAAAERVTGRRARRIVQLAQRIALTRIRSATATESERKSKWKCFNPGKRDRAAGGRSLHRMVRCFWFTYREITTKTGIPLEH